MKENPEKYRLSHDQVREFMTSLSNWGRWGPEDQLGCLNFITPKKRSAAATLVKEGVCVSLSRPLPTEPAADNAIPVQHSMVTAGTDRQAPFSADEFKISPHGYATTHLDALCHVFYRDSMYNGFSRDKVTLSGAEANSIDLVHAGIITRGVLLDIARAKGKDWLEPGEPIFPEDLKEAEKVQQVSVEQADFLLVRTGRFAYRERHGPWKAHELLAGLHASCLPWLHLKEIAALGCDGVSDVIPSQEEKFRLPVHMVGLVAMGLHLLDNADLEALGRVCAERGRWEFLFIVSPLLLMRGTGSPVNPLAIF